MTTIAPPRMRWVGRATVDVGTPVRLDAAGGRVRLLVPVLGGAVVGQWSGAICAGGGDWQTVHEDGSVTIDAMYPVQIENGPTVCFVARGVRRAGAPGGAFCTSLFLEGDAPPGIGSTVYLAVGHKAADAVEFDLYEVA